MSAIAGLVEWTEGKDPGPACSAMIEALAPFGPARQTVHRLGAGCFGHALSIHLPEDRHDQQPLESGSKAVLLSADVRLDNRDELAEARGIGAEAAQLSDADILLRCWERWGEDSLSHILGDFAFAIWDGDRRELMLTRSPATTRTLFYYSDGQRAAFASMPQALHRLESIPKQLNLDELARRLVGRAYFGNRETLFVGILCVDPGTIVHITEGSVRISRWWDAAAVPTVRREPAEAARMLRAEFDRSVAACLRRSAGPVASHLSGGRDSGAVASIAANILCARGEYLTAYTAAPRAGFPAGSSRYLHDESALAAEVAGGAANLRHVVSRSEPMQLCPALDEASAVHFGPMGNPANMAYWMRILATAAHAGSSVLLTGANGNFSISIGGLGALADVVREKGISGWWPVARRLAAEGKATWKTIVNQSFGHHMPARLHRFLRRGFHGPPGQEGYPLFRRELRARIERSLNPAASQPYESYREKVRQIYRVVDHADKVGLAIHGIDLRDPTADRRLIEFCLSLPADQIVGSQGQRPIYDLAFADVMPASVRSNPLKGFQGADWFEVYDPEEIRAGFRCYAGNRLVRELIDMDEVDPLLDAWPTERGYEIATYSLYANHVLVALALASWVDVHFPEERDR